MQDAIFAKVASNIKPGMRDIDVTALAQHEGQVRGSEQGIFLGSSAPVGQRAGSCRATSRAARSRPATIWCC